MARKTLRRLTHTGWLIRLTAGRYAIVPPSGDETTPQVNCYVATRELLGETSYYIYHESAMDVHNVLTRPVTYASPSALWGCEPVWVTPYEQVTVSDLEMTILDGLARPDLCAEVGHVATGLWIRQDDFDWNRLAFYGMTLPEAILALKQGVGRLIRTETDRGVVTILDSRINTRRYGQQIVASLPRARRTRRIADVRRFFAEERTTN